MTLIPCYPRALSFGTVVGSCSPAGPLHLAALLGQRGQCPRPGDVGQNGGTAGKSPDELARLGTTAPSTEQAIQFRRRALVALAWQMQQGNAPEAPAREAVRTLARFYCDEERSDRPPKNRSLSF